MTWEDVATHWYSFRADCWRLYGRDPWDMNHIELCVALRGLDVDSRLHAIAKRAADEGDPLWWKAYLPSRREKGARKFRLTDVAEHVTGG